MFAPQPVAVARYLAGALVVCQPPFLGLAPVNLVTVASPHLGVRPVLLGMSGRIAMRALQAVGGRTGDQLTGLDGSELLLAHMAFRSSAFRAPPTA